MVNTHRAHTNKQQADRPATLPLAFAPRPVPHSSVASTTVIHSSNTPIQHGSHNSRPEGDHPPRLSLRRRRCGSDRRKDGGWRPAVTQKKRLRPGGPFGPFEAVRNALQCSPVVVHYSTLVAACFTACHVQCVSVGAVGAWK